jgi:hypothetical protein
MSLDDFRRNLLRVGAVALAAAHPEYADTFRAALGPEARDYEAARSAVEHIPTPRFTRWRNLLVGVADIELYMAKLRSSLLLLGTVPDPDALRGCMMSQGTWVEYHLSMWHFSALGLIERSRRLFTQSYRLLFRDCPPAQDPGLPHFLAKLTNAELLVKDLRHSLAHGGGYVEALGEQQFIEPFALLGSWFDIASVLDHVKVFQERWCGALRDKTVVIIASIHESAGDE